MTDIFDLKNVDDVPENLIKGLNWRRKRKRKNDDLEKIFSLFEIKSTLSTDEVMVGFYRRHGIQKNKHWHNQRMCQLFKKKLIKRVSCGVYEKIQDNERE